MDYVYILKCRDNSLYTGYTNNIVKRLEMHNNGKGAKYTMGRYPVELVYFETFNTKSEALKREYQIKQLSRQDKLLMLKSFDKKEIQTLLNSESLHY